MRAWKITVLVVVGLMFGSIMGMACTPPPPGPDKADVIIAGQTEIVGNYEVWIYDDYMVVKFWIDSGWCLEDNHILVTKDMTDYVNKKWNPKIGKFPFEAEWDGDAYVCTILKSEYPELWGTGALWIAIHVVVSDCCGSASETGWGYGEEEWGSSWGWYFDP